MNTLIALLDIPMPYARARQTHAYKRWGVYEEELLGSYKEPGMRQETNGEIGLTKVRPGFPSHVIRTCR